MYEITTIEGKSVVIDVTQLVSDEVLYINATRLAKQFGKSRQNLRKFLNSKAFLEYVEALSKVRKNRTLKPDETTQSKVTKNRDLKTNESNESVEFKVNLFDYFKNGLPLIKSVKGKYGGTYLHSDLAIFFFRWLNPEFAVMCDMFIRDTIRKINEAKIAEKAIAKANRDNEEWLKARTQAKEARRELTSAIKAFCNYAQASRGEPYRAGKCPYYVKLTKLIYKALGIAQPKGATPPREIFNGATLEKIEHLEALLYDLIKEEIEQCTEYHEAYKHIKATIEEEARQISGGVV